MDDSTAAVSARTPYARRAAAALAGAALAAGLLTACGSSGTPTVAVGTASSGTSAPASPSAPAPSASAATPSAPASAAASSPAPEASPQPSAQPTTPGIAVGERPPTAVKIPATGYRQDGPTQLTVFFTAGICDKYGVRVEEDAPPVVKLRVVVTQTAEPGKACPQAVKEQQAVVRLSQPMTGGGVVDTATGEQLPVVSGVAGGDPR
ncbi:MULTISPECIES: hypothetical protein [Kitasatospora]|uniref:Lipoprotein n=1 Tax=Kitasatospora setae (strain ATCC 33774 / DSM 43861 / JCM 3304 / KCC A-0304 / NBRC 14216 / KM-6054) TaxID=452652 RepID=E4N9Z1_KITSK|nr:MULTISPECIES: hypothetical protein [Kitasatospora]BAJ28022.1 hypothetical protein KSE_22000 [Kitasatospora setae KM-6054]